MQNMIAIIIGGIGAYAFTVVLCCRLLLQTSLTFSSAVKATVLAWTLCVLAVLALPLFGIRARVLTDPVVSWLALSAGTALQVAILTWLGKTVDEEPIGLRQALIATVVASLLGYAAGWLAWEYYQPSSDAAAPARQLDGLSPAGQLCVQSLAGMLSDIGSGSSRDAARVFMQNLEQDARAQGIPMEQALKLELNKLGSQVPAPCRHLR